MEFGKKACFCGKVVASSYYNRHLLSSCHKKAVEKQLQLDDSSDDSDSVKCECGHYINEDLMDEHLKSDIHRLEIEKYKDDSFISSEKHTKIRNIRRMMKSWNIDELDKLSEIVRKKKI